MQPCTMMMVRCWSLLWGQMYPGEGSALQHKINPGQLTQFWSSLNFNKGQIEEIISHGLVLQSFHVKQISWQNHEWNMIKFRYTGFREYFKWYSIDGYIYRSIASFAGFTMSQFPSTFIPSTSVYWPLSLNLRSIDFFIRNFKNVLDLPRFSRF